MSAHPQFLSAALSVPLQYLSEALSAPLPYLSEALSALFLARGSVICGEAK